MDFSFVKDILQKDAISAGYGVASGSIRKLANKVLGKRGVGQGGVNVATVVTGLALSKVNNPHVQILGAALRIGGIASFGNALVEKVLSRKEENSDEQ